MMPNKLAAPNPAIASQLHGGRHWRGIGEPERYPTFRIMCKIIIPFLVLSSISSLSLAQEQAIPAIRILPEDVVQDSIRQFQRSTNKFRVMWTYTEAGAKKMLAF